jgi:hypothetical protein
MKMKKVTSISIPQKQVDLILKTIKPPQGQECFFDFKPSKKGLDLYVGAITIGDGIATSLISGRLETFL